MISLRVESYYAHRIGPEIFPKCVSSLEMDTIQPRHGESSGSYDASGSCAYVTNVERPATNFSEEVFKIKAASQPVSEALPLSLSIRLLV
jgi:hypothetical protein